MSPGRFFEMAISSLTVFGGNEGCSTSRILRLGRDGDELKVILIGSNLSLSIAGLVAWTRRDLHDRVAVGRGAHEQFRRDGGIGARSILDHVGDAALLGELLREQAGDDVVRAAGREPDVETYRTMSWKCPASQCCAARPLCDGARKQDRATTTRSVRFMCTAHGDIRQRWCSLVICRLHHTRWSRRPVLHATP